MNEQYCDIFLPNNITISHVLDLGCNTFRTSYLIEESFLDFGVGDVRIVYSEDEYGNVGGEMILQNAKKGTFILSGDKKYNTFTFNVLSKSDLQYAQTRSDIEYLAMMTETDL